MCAVMQASEIVMAPTSRTSELVAFMTRSLSWGRAGICLAKLLHDRVKERLTRTDMFKHNNVEEA